MSKYYISPELKLRSSKFCLDPLMAKKDSVYCCASQIGAIPLIQQMNDRELGLKNWIIKIVADTFIQLSDQFI